MGAEAYFNQERIVKLEAKVIEELKAKAKENASGKYRLCLHHSPQDKLHEMFIVQGKGNYGRPAKHSYTTESNTIIEGALLIIIFDDDGNITDCFELSQEKYHSFRIDTDIYHMSIPLTEQVVFYETKLGPFIPDEGNIFADWAPDPHDTKRVAAYMKELEEKLKDFCEGE